MIRSSAKYKLLLPLAAIAGLALFPFPKGGEDEFWKRFFDAGHFPAFMLLYVLLYFLFPNYERRVLSRRGFTLLVTALTALALELVQPLVGRSGSPADFAVGALGTLAGYTGLPLWRTPRYPAKRWIHTAVCMIIFGGIAFPMMQQLEALTWRRVNFPLLGRFEEIPETRLWNAITEREAALAEVKRVRDHAAEGRHSLRVVTVTGRFSGVRYRAGDFDWSAYKNLALEIFNPGEPFELFIRIDDDGDTKRFEDRYNGRFRIGHGLNPVRVALPDVLNGPKDRKLNLKAVRRALIFVEPSSTRRTFYLDYVRLEEE